MAKINWSAALTKYLMDQSLSYADIAKEFGLSTKAVANQAKKENWPKLRQETYQKIIQKLPEKISEEAVEANKRHLQIAKVFQSKGLEVLKEKLPETFTEAKETIKDGIELERKALGLNIEQKQPIAVQVNFVSKEIEDWAT
jgi:FKBP-type peptidyl-prolyl cis-trans isomerase (trigger factor)